MIENVDIAAMLKIVCCEHSSLQHDARNGFCRVCSCTEYRVAWRDATNTTTGET